MDEPGIPQLSFLVIFVFALPIALLPTIIATRKNLPHKVPIILVNIFGGMFFGIGWLIALVWCFTKPGNQQSELIKAAKEIEKLHQLKEKGVIGQVEFDSKKKELMDMNKRWDTHQPFDN
jgi:hypothetical protein